MKRSMINIILVLAIAGFTSACSKMDDYKKISGTDEIGYPGKIEEVKIYSGDQRVVINGVCKSDPKVVKCRVFWALGTRYVDIPVDMSEGSFTISREIPLDEGVYNFDICTYDAAGNKSVPVNVNSQAYGKEYRESIGNRVIKSSKIEVGDGIIEWYGMDLTLGPIETEITYTTNSGRSVTIKLPIGGNVSVLSSYKPGSPIEYVTVYRPATDCVDTFRTNPGHIDTL